MKRYSNDSASSGSSKRYKKTYKTYKKAVRPTVNKIWKPIIPGMNKQTYTFTRHGVPIPPLKFVASDVGLISQKALTLSFTLSQAEGAADFTALYDQYRIRAVQVKFSPISLTINNLNSSALSSGQSPTLMSVIDYDDSTDLPSASVARQYSTCIVNQYSTSQSKATTRYFTPASLTQLYRTLTTTGYSSKYGQWIDVATNDVPHYGMKFLMTTPVTINATDTNVGYQIDTKYYLEFRNSR